MVSYAQPEWNRDQSEYDELNKVEANINSYSRLIRGGARPTGEKLTIREWINYIKGYAAELWTYYKWLKPYIDKTIATNFKIKDKLTKSKFFMEGTLEHCDVLINEGFSKLNYNTLPQNFNKAFSLLEEVEKELKNNKVMLRMGVRVENFETEGQKYERRIKNTMGV
jgi:hypothetical protein